MCALAFQYRHDLSELSMSNFDTIILAILQKSSRLAPSIFDGSTFFGDLEYFAMDNVGRYYQYFQDYLVYFGHR